MILKYNGFLNEKVIHPDYKFDLSLDEYYHILSYKKYIMFFTFEELEELDNIPKKVKKLLDIKDGDDDFRTYLQEKRPDIIVLGWQVGSKDLNIDLNNVYNQDVNTSKHFIDTLKVLKNELNVKFLDTSEFREGKQDTEETFHINNLIAGFTKDVKVRKLPDVVYHGTTTKYLKEIFTVGLRPGKGETNFDDIYHTDRLFFSSSETDSHYYAIHSASNVGGIPIVLEVSTKNMDTSKIDLDYDFYVDNVKRGNQDYDNIFYGTMGDTKEFAKNPHKNLKKLKDKYVGATYRKFAYVGNVFPKEFTNLKYSISWENENFEEEFENPTKNKESIIDILDFFNYIEEKYGAGDYVADYDYYLEKDEREEQEREEQYELELQEKKYTNMKDYLQFIKEGGVTGVENHQTGTQGTQPVKGGKSTFDNDYSPQAAEMEIVFDDVQDAMKQLLQSSHNMSSEEASGWVKDLIVDTKQRQEDIKHIVAQMAAEGNGVDGIAQDLLDKYLEKTEINQDFDSPYTDQEIPNKLMGE